MDDNSVLEEFELRRRYKTLYRYKPYKKQRDFHEAGAKFRERALFAGNQLGKTLAGAHELAMHLTGLYPDWWTGHRYDRPIIAWVGADTNETSREVVQPALLGTEEANLNSPDLGTGAIPRDKIERVTKRQAGVIDVVDQIWVHHKTGGLSRAVLKSYDQKRKAWQGKKVDYGWLDEEPPFDIYSEMLTRTNAAKNAKGEFDGRLACTFTPLQGRTKVVQRFIAPDKGASPTWHSFMSIMDVDHYTPARKSEIVAGYPEWEREARANGRPMLGEGLVFPVAWSQVAVEPFHIPKYFAKINGLDFGTAGDGGHETAVVFLAHDRDRDIVYVYDCYKAKGQTTVYHSEAIKSRGEWIPVAWPHDGVNVEAANGLPRFRTFSVHGVNMLGLSARYENDKGGSQPTEPSIDHMLERLLTGRLKVFSFLNEWQNEFQSYHRKEGKIVAMYDDLLKATMYGLMMIRYGASEIESSVGVSRRKLAVGGGW